ncbi:hypothetical protein Javan124_0018 [Streptococcus phage Javan124]|nr:hypothetical protein Javan124_0018 [Streptococcus phage Javan124]
MLGLPSRILRLVGFGFRPLTAMAITSSSATKKGLRTF